MDSSLSLQHGGPDPYLIFNSFFFLRACIEFFQIGEPRKDIWLRGFTLFSLFFAALLLALSIALKINKPSGTFTSYLSKQVLTSHRWFHHSNALSAVAIHVVTRAVRSKAYAQDQQALLTWKRAKSSIMLDEHLAERHERRMQYVLCHMFSALSQLIGLVFQITG